jgi:hypothetical protein
MVIVYIILKYRGGYYYHNKTGGNSVSFFSLFPYGNFGSLFTKCTLQNNLYFLRGWG